MGEKKVRAEEDMMKHIERYGDCLRWLAQGYMDGEELSDRVCPECGAEMLKRMGPHGSFLACRNSECGHVEAMGDNEKPGE